MGRAVRVAAHFLRIMERSLRLTVTSCIFLWSAVVCATEWGPTVKLLRPDSLVGWDHGDAHGWTINNGVLTGGRHGSRLVSGWTVGEARLTLDWKAEPGGTITLGLEAPRSSQAVELSSQRVVVRETTGRDQRVATCDGFDATGDFVRLSLVRQGATLAFEIVHDGVTRTRAIAIGKIAPALLTLRVTGGRASIREITLREPSGEAIFNEKDLGGWWTPGNGSAWRAEHGELVKRGDNGNYLRSEKDYANFVLAFEYRIDKGGNSGVGIRTARDGWPSAEGMELQLQDQPGLDKHSTMAIYGNVPPVARADRSEEWNQAVVRAQGPMISAWMNGELVQHTHVGRHPELKHHPASGWIGWQDHGGVNRFRTIRLLELPEGVGPAAWHVTSPPDATTLVLNRLVNTEQLAVRDGLESQFAIARVDGSGVQTLAALTGPGVLVGITRPNDAGQLAFYFDDETKPRLTCRVSELPTQLPALSETQGPLLTFVPFGKRLKLELRDGQRGTFGLDAVQLPPDTPLASFEGKQTLPAFWEATLDYRRHQQKQGNRRTSDGYPKVASPVVSLRPGDHRKLIEVEGAGIVEWIEIAKRPATEDLWLEFHVDGEPIPAILAPARALFAPVRDGQGHPSYVFLPNRPDGATLRWAVPFHRGLSITAHNRGKAVLEDVALLACVHPAEPSVTEGMMRLRGAYHRGTSATDLHLTGRGRLVSLVCEQDDRDAVNRFVVTTLAIDGRPQPTWAQMPIEAFLGRPTRDDFRAELTGRVGGLTWRHFVLAPLSYDTSLTLKVDAPHLQSRLALYYQ